MVIAVVLHTHWPHTPLLRAWDLSGEGDTDTGLAARLRENVWMSLLITKNNNLKPPHTPHTDTHTQAWKQHAPPCVESQTDWMGWDVGAIPIYPKSQVGAPWLTMIKHKRVRPCRSLPGTYLPRVTTCVGVWARSGSEPVRQQRRVGNRHEGDLHYWKLPLNCRFGTHVCRCLIWLNCI